MPSSRDFPKHFRRGERLKADDMTQISRQLHQLASVGDAGNVIAIGGGVFRREKRNPPQIRDAVLTSNMTAAGAGAPQDGKTDFTFKMLFQDKDDPALLIEGDEEFDGVNRNAGLTGSTGDYVAVAKMGVEWRALGGGGGGGGSTSFGDCACGGCLDAGTVSACAAIGDAPLSFAFPLTGILASAFGSTVILSHSSGCTWESDVFESVDIGDGAHDYTFRLVFTGKSIEEAELTLEDET